MTFYEVFLGYDNFQHIYESMYSINRVVKRKLNSFRLKTSILYKKFCVSRKKRFVIKTTRYSGYKSKNLKMFQEKDYLLYVSCFVLPRQCIQLEISLWKMSSCDLNLVFFSHFCQLHFCTNCLIMSLVRI